MAIVVTLLHQGGDPIGEVGSDLLGLDLQAHHVRLTVKGNSPLIRYLMNCRQAPLKVRVDGCGWSFELDVTAHAYTFSDGQWLSRSKLTYR